MTVTLLTCHDARVSPERQDELEACLERNTGNDRIEKVVVFSTGRAPDFAHPKLETVSMQRRPTWADLIAHANDRLAGRTCLVAHAGVHFDETLSYFDDVAFSRTCLAIAARGDGRRAGSGRPFDALAFGAPLEGVRARFPVGARGAEGRLAYELQKGRYTVRGVGGSVNAFHVHGAFETGQPVCRGPQAPVPLPVAGRPKVFGIGLQRTGTSSLRTALNMLDIPTLEHFGCWFLIKIRDGQAVLEPSVNHEYFQGFADSPVPAFFRELDAVFPGSRFIFTTRDRDGWLDSVERLFRYKPRWDELPEAPLINAYHRLSYGTTAFDRAAFEACFDRHERAVRAHFAGRPDDLLVLEAAAPGKWEKLCRFLDRPEPAAAYPHANRSTSVAGRVRRAFASAAQLFLR